MNGSIVLIGMCVLSKYGMVIKLNFISLFNEYLQHYIVQIHLFEDVTSDWNGLQTYANIVYPQSHPRINQHKTKYP